MKNRQPFEIARRITELPKLRAVVPALALAVPVAITAACYGPTEVAVVITTDLACSEGPRTAIYKGMPFDSAPDAVTEACESVPNADSRIGSLVFLPSGDANGRAAVKVVLARKQNVAECEAHPEECIVATRSFSFVEHLSRRVPIRMFSACLGKQCPDGQTCGAGGVCVSNEVACTSDDCDVEPVGEEDGGRPPVVDAGSDAGSTPPLPGACGGPSGDGTLAVISGGVLDAALGANVHYYVEGSTSKLMSVPKSGGEPSLVTPNRGVFSALAATGTDWFFAYRGAQLTKTNATLVTSSGAVLNMGAAPITALAATTEGGGSVAYVGRATTVERVTGGEGVSTFNPKGGANRIAVDGAFVYMSTPGGIAVRQRTDASSSGELPITPNVGQEGVAFATRGGKAVFAAGTLNGTPGIFALNGGSPATVVVEKTDAITSIAVDGAFVFATDGTTIQRWIMTANGSIAHSVLYTAASGESVDHLTADKDCLYYWSSPPGILPRGVLRAIATKAPIDSGTKNFDGAPSGGSAPAP